MCRNKDEGWWWVILARSPRLGWNLQDLNKTSRILSIYTWECVRRKIKINTTLVVFSAHKRREEKDEKLSFNTYMRGKLIKMNLEPLFPCLILARTRNMKEMMKILEEFLRLPWEREWAETWEGEKEMRLSDLVIRSWKHLEDFNDRKYPRNGLGNLTYGVVDFCWKIFWEGGRERVNRG